MMCTVDVPCHETFRLSKLDQLEESVKATWKGSWDRSAK